MELAHEAASSVETSVAMEDDDSVDGREGDPLHTGPRGSPYALAQQEHVYDTFNANSARCRASPKPLSL